ncbi:hypothetical protein Tco_0141494, partial [Tanacetum coccineum]
LLVFYILNPTLEDLAVGTPSSKILVKAKASQKRKASTSGTTSSYVAKRTSSNDESDYDDNACVEIPLVTPLHSATVIPPQGTRVGALLLPMLKDLTPEGIMADDADAPSVGVNRPRPSSRPVPSFMDVSGDAIHADFLPFSAGPYYVIYP